MNIARGPLPSARIWGCPHLARYVDESPLTSAVLIWKRCSDASSLAAATRPNDRPTRRGFLGCAGHFVPEQTIPAEENDRDNHIA